MIKILSLNLWRYNDFDIRFENLLKVISNKNPDIILLQESQIDQSFSRLSQVEIIKNKINEVISKDYKFSHYSTVYLKKYQKGEKLEIPVQHGMGIISKYPVVNSFEYYLNIIDKNPEPRSIFCFDLEIEDHIHKFANVHFTNNDIEAPKELQEFLGFIENRNERRIMCGDFNIFNLSEYLKNNKDYTLSTKFKKYILYEKDNGTLDYVLLPKEYNFIDFECLNDYLSDHKGIFAVVQEKKLKQKPKKKL